MSAQGQPRDRAGRFEQKPQSTPEVTLAPAPQAHTRVRYKNRIHRVMMTSGEVTVLATPTGGRVMARADELEPVVEADEERARNVAIERGLAEIVASVKAATRLQRDQLNDIPVREAERYADALGRAGSAVAEGRASATNWLVGHHCAQGQPAGARLAIAALVAREGMSEEDFDTLTEVWRRYIGPLPEEG